MPTTKLDLLQLNATSQPLAEKPATLLELFENHPERWTCGVNARMPRSTIYSNQQLQRCNPDDPRAVCWCLSGALDLVYPESTRQLVIAKLFETIGILYRYKYPSVPTFNDSVTYKDVMNVLRVTKV